MLLKLPLLVSIPFYFHLCHCTTEVVPEVESSTIAAVTEPPLTSTSSALPDTDVPEGSTTTVTVETEPVSTVPDMDPDDSSATAPSATEAAEESTTLIPTATESVLQVSNSTGYSSECVVEDTTYVEGDIITETFLGCVNDTFYNATMTTCGENGSTEETWMQLECDVMAPLCLVQCDGTSLCTADISVIDCTEEENPVDAVVEAESDMGSGCVVDGVTYSEGEKIGFVGFDCADNETSVYGTEIFCGTNGTLVEGEDVVQECDFICVQCDESVAFCTNTTSEDACSNEGDNDTEGLQEAENTTDGCVVGNSTYAVGDRIEIVGWNCTSDTSFYAIETFCGQNGSTMEMDKTLQCDFETPHCVMCGDSGPGAALCLESPDVPEQCQDGTIESFGANPSSAKALVASTGCLESTITFGLFIGHLSVVALFLV